jgi:hypothetical protein
VAKKKKKKAAKSSSRNGPPAKPAQRSQQTRKPVDEEGQATTNMELKLGNEKYVIIRMLEAVTANQGEMIKLLREIRDRLPEK